MPTAYRSSRLTKAFFFIFFLLLLAYAYFEGRGLLYGPSITISSHVTEVNEPYIKIRGQADHIASLSLNGKNIPVSEAGIFEEPFVLQPGENRIVFLAVDKYGRKRQKELDIVYSNDPALSSVDSPTGTSTEPMSATST